jgi:hypothetical protein
MFYNIQNNTRVKNIYEIEQQFNFLVNIIG